MNEQNPNPETQNLKHAWFVVGILTLAYVSSFIDRQILSLLVKPIKRDLNISDTQISLLMGLSFALFYTFLGIPIARLADTQNRKKIIAWGIGLWSIMTALCGITKNFNQLFLARMGVGIGESALSPSAYSMIADLFPKNKLAAANSVYNMGIFIGSGMAFLLGGLVVKSVTTQGLWNLPIIGDVFPWQVVFFAVGLPGLLIVFIISLFKEPVRKSVGQRKISLSETFKFLMKEWKVYLTLNLGMAFVTMVNYATAAWVPTFFDRTYGWGAGKAGMIFGAVVMVFSTIGLWVGGKLADYYTEKGNVLGRIKACILLITGFFATCWIFPIMPTGEAAAIALVPVAFFSSSMFGAGTAAILEVTPSQMRGMASAIYLFFANLIGLTFGPLMVAILTDKVFHDEKAIRFSLLFVMLGGLILSLLFMILSQKPYLKMDKKSGEM
jgi:MFS family permease